MQALDYDAYLMLTAEATVLEADRHGAKVLRLRDGNFIKLFRRKRLISSAIYYPYAKRFADNARLLHRRNIPCPKVLEVFRVKALQRDAVHYQPLIGETVRWIYLHYPDRANRQLKEKLGSFIASLHDQGIYFRSLHLGNIIITPEDGLGLIDISDLKNHKTPLSMHERLRNFQHILRYSEDKNWLLNDSAQTFFNSYIAACKHPSSLQLAKRLKNQFI